MPRGRPSVALVLAGGGAKGYAHLPVLELIEELDIPIDMIIGTSAGAIIGGLYSAGYSPEMMKDIFFDLDWDTIFQDRTTQPFEYMMGGQSLERNPLNVRFSRSLALSMGRGFSTGQEVYRLFRSLTAKIPSYINFDDLPIPFRSTGVELTTGTLKVFAEGDLAEAIRASMSIPAVFEPFNIDDKYYLDGGVLDNLPVNQAKALGYDIVIAVDLPDKMTHNAQAFDASPLTVLGQTLAIYLHAAKESQYAQADTVLFPDVEQYELLDFPKAWEIYRHVEQQRESFRDALLAVRGKIYGNTSVVPAVSKGDRYSSRPDITVRRLELSGALAVDEQFIRRQFERVVMGKPATGERLSGFIEDVYRTGNYVFVAARIDTRGREPLLELRLLRADSRNAYIAFGGDFQETLASDVLLKLALTLDTQFRGLTGPGSILSFGGTMPHILSFHAFYLQPLSQRLFFSARAKAVQDRDSITSGFTWHGQTGNSLLSVEARTGLGWKADEANAFTLDLSYLVGAYVDGVTDYLTFTREMDNGLHAQALGLSLGWEYNTLDFPAFASRGLFLKLGNAVYYPFFDIASADFTLAIPLTGETSLALNAAAGGDLSGNLQKLPDGFPYLFGYNTADRLFFPQIAGRQRYGGYKAAASFGIQTQPFIGQRLMGVHWVFALSTAAGAIFDDFAELSGERLYWNAAFNIGVRFTRAFGAVFRIGAGKGERPGIAPLVSFDLGCLRY
jgi:NTE family protein